jgi:hypothetical protein
MHPVVYLFDKGTWRVSLHNNVLKHNKTTQTLLCQHSFLFVNFIYEFILINYSIQKLMLIFVYAWRWPRKRVEICSVATKANKNECWHSSVYFVLLCFKTLLCRLTPDIPLSKKLVAEYFDERWKLLTRKNHGKISQYGHYLRRRTCICS